MYRTINGQLTNITVKVTDKCRMKRKCKAWATDKTFFENFCTSQGSHVLLSPRRCTSSVWTHGPPFHTRFLAVSMRSLSVIIHWTCGQCLEHRLTCCTSGRRPAMNQVHWSSTDTNWTSIRQGPHKFWTKRMPAHSYRTSSGRLCSKFCACINLSAGLNGPCMTRSTFAEWETDKKHILFSVGVH